jgi:hypothetical protein
VKKWIIGAIVVAGAVLAVAVLTKPGGVRRGPGGSQVLDGDNPSSRLVSQNEKLKEISRKVAEERAEKRRNDRPAQARPIAPRPMDEGTKAIATAMGQPFAQTGYVPMDPARHQKSNDVVKSKDKLDALADPAARPKAAANWGAIAPVSWKRMTQLYTGFSIGRSAGGDFKPEVVRELNGAAVEVEGAVMPIDPVGPDGKLKRFWIARPEVVTAGCVFCKPPSLGDLVYVTTKDAPMQVDREKLYSGVVIAKVVGRFELGPTAAKDGTQYLFGLELKKTE